MSRPPKGPTLRPNSKRGGTYYIYYSEAGAGRSRRHSTGTSDQREAVEYFGRWLENNSRAEWTGPRRADETLIIDVLQLYADRHVAEKIPSAAGRAKAAQCIVALSKWWSDRTCDVIKPETCRAYVRARGVATSTSARELTVLRAALGYAYKNGHLVERPFVELPSTDEQPPPRDRWLTRSEAARLLWESRRTEEARGHLPLFIQLMLRTAARPGALFELRWVQIDFDNNRIDFNPPGRQRSKKERPIVPIPRRLRWFLLRAHARATSPFVLSYNGQPLQSVKKAFRNARKRAGLGPDVVPYTLRHTCATWLMQAEIEVQMIGGWLGHKDPKTTRRYTHHHPSYMDRARRVLD
jgi:integrase